MYELRRVFAPLVKISVIVSMLICRGKMMGGSSSINSMAYVRGNKVDYDTWADMGNIGWSFKDVRIVVHSDSLLYDINKFN